MSHVGRKDNLAKVSRYPLPFFYDLRAGDDGRGLIGVTAFLRTGIDRRCHIVIRRAGDDGTVGVGSVAVERRVDHGVGAAGGGAAVNVVAYRVSGGGPAEVDGVLGWRGSGAGQRLHGG